MPRGHRALAARPCPHQAHRRIQGQGRAGRALRAHRRRRGGRQARQLHRAPDAGGLRRAQGPPHLPAACSWPTRCASSATASPSSSPRRCTQARDAAELVEIDYEPLPAVVELEDAAKDGAAKVWDDCPQGNVGFRLMFGNKDATDAAFAEAKHVVKLRVENNRLSPVAMEPRVAIGDYNVAEDTYTLYTASQNPHGVRMEMSHIFHVPENQIRVISPDVGGGFGLKGDPFPDDALVLWASRRLRRPVKWVATRSESMLTDHHGREMVYYGELALDEHGKILALRARLPVPARRLFRRRSAGGGRILAALHSGGLRHPDHAHHVAGPVHQHVAVRALSRRRSSRGGLFHGAADRARGARDRHRSRRDPAAQPDPAEQAALRHADAMELRQRRVRAPAWTSASSSATGRALRHARRPRRRTASCAAAP